MEEELEDWSSLHSQLLFPPCEPSHRQREYELERHLALMDGPPRTPGRKLTDMDLGNLTIEHFPSQETKDDCFMLMEEEKYPDESFFDIGIEATDLGSLLQQFELTEAALLTSPDHSVTATCKSKCKGSSLQLPDPEALAKKITPIKRKSAILLEPQPMPTKRLRSKDAVLPMADRECVSLPGSRTSSPVPTPHNGLSIICSADQGFDYLVMDHDYCSNGEQVTSRVSSAASSPRNNSKRLSVEERKAVYKQKYRIRKKVRKTPQTSKKDTNKSAFLEQEQLNLINKLPDYIQPMPEVVPTTKTVPSQEKTEKKSSETAQVDSQEKKHPIVEQEKPTFFDKIPDYFIGKHMYQEISKVQEEEARKKEEEEMAKREEDKKREEDAKKAKNKDLAKEHHQNGHRSQHPEGKKMKNRQHAITSVCESNANSSKQDAIKASAVYSEVPVETSKELNSENKIEPKEKTEICNKECPEDKYDPIDRKCKPECHTGRSRRKSSCSERRSLSRSISLSSRSRSRSKSSFRSRSRSSSLSWSSRSRERRRRNSRISCGSLSSVSSCSSSRSRSRSRSRSQSRSRSRSRSRSFSRSRSRSRARSYRGHRRRHSTYSSASRSSSRSHSRSLSRSRHWRPRSRSRSRSRSRRSRSRSHYSRRSHSQDSDRRHRRDSHRRRSRSRSRRRMRSISIEREEESRKQQLKEQDEQWADRRVVYIGRIPYGTTRGIIRRRFIKYGEIERITLHFRDVGDNYAFVTYVYKCDAYAAVEGAKTDTEEPQYDVCFGGRRQFCKTSYADLDSMGQEEMALEFGYDQAPTCTGNHSNNAMETDFDRLLREAMKKTKR